MATSPAGEIADLRRELARLRAKNARLSRLLRVRGEDTEPGSVQLAAPVSFAGLLVQCAGRVVRSCPGKDTAEAHDYHGEHVPVLAAMLRKRLPGYRELGFTRRS